MSERPLLIPGYARILHGGDYNPDQWLGEPSVIVRSLDSTTIDRAPISNQNL